MQLLLDMSGLDLVPDAVSHKALALLTDLFAASW